MSGNPGGDSDKPKASKLLSRDWILLPGISLLTIALIILTLDLIQWYMLSTSSGSGEDCIIFDDPSTGARGRPNSVCYEKPAEGEFTEYRLNSCGHRTSLECDSKPKGSYRIVLVGGSYAMGMRVPIEKAFATLLPLELSQLTGWNVELYNEGMPWRPPRIISDHFDVVLRPNPNLILWIIAPSDVWNPLYPDRLSASPASPVAGGDKQSVPVKIENEGRREFVYAADLFRSFFRSILIRYVLYKSQSWTINSYLRQPPDTYEQKIHGPEYLKREPSEEWQRHLLEFETNVASIIKQAGAAGVPVAVTLLPERPQAAMIARGEWPASFDPYKLDTEFVPQSPSPTGRISISYRNSHMSQTWNDILCRSMATPIPKGMR